MRQAADLRLPCEAPCNKPSFCCVQDHQDLHPGQGVRIMLQRIDNRSLAPIRRAATRWGLAGGALALDAVLAFMATSGYWYFSQGMVLAVSGACMVAGAVVAALFARAVQRRQGSLRRVEQDLEKAAAMMERGLIDREDYLQIKRSLFQGLRLGQPFIESLLPAALWGAFAGLTLPLLVFAATAVDPLAALLVSAGAGAVGALFSGGAAAGYVYVFEQRLGRLLPPGPEAGWRRLGEPKNESTDRDSG
jgi:hypothetical protein